VKYLNLPGLSDVHVHFRQPGATHKEDFTTGTQAAIAGGYTQVLDMPNNSPSTTSPNDLKAKIKLANGKIWCDLGFNFGATRESVVFFNLVKSKVFGLKLYLNKTTGPLLIENQSDRELIFKSWESDLPIMVHAMGETIEVAIKFAKKYRKRIHVCHVTTDQINTIKKAKKDKVEITSEVAPHHLFLNQNDLKKLGPLGFMQPPLMSKKDQEKIWDHLDFIDMIATDHAPHTLKEKINSKQPPFGVPGLETTLPLMLSAVAKRLITQKRLIEMLSTNPKQIFKLPKQEKTFSIVDLTKKYKIQQKKLFTKCAWTPFRDLEGVGEIKQVFLTGAKVFEDGVFLGKPSGKIMTP
jgi:carbamoyl-phosphate synthase/aspartate carbamoyltransferase/dihydroorotase